MKQPSKYEGVLVSVVSVLFAMCASTVTAQDQDDSDTTESDSDAGEIEQIVVTGSQIVGISTASPVMTLDRAEMDARGISSVEDLLRYIPQNFSNINSGGRADGRTPRFEDGVVTVNLRGLGEGSTLVLVNGRRIAASPAESGTFTDVSTIPFAAIERIEVLTDGASAIYGSDAVGGVINFILKQEYRGFQPRVRHENSSSGGDGVTVEATGGYSWGSGNLTGSVSLEQADPVNRYNAGLPDDGDFSAHGGRVVVDPASQQGSPPTRSTRWPLDVTPDSETVSAYLDLRQEIAENLSLSLSGLFSERQSQTRGLYNSLRFRVPPSNYYSMAAMPPITVPSLKWYAFFNETDAGLLDRPFNVANSKRHSVSATLDWVLPYRDWEATASLGYGENEFDGYRVGLSETNPAVIAAVASGDPAAALNLFGDGSMQRPDLNSLLSRTDQGARISEQEYVTLGLRGTMFELPAGEVKFYVGAERRDDGTNFTGFRLNPIGFMEPSLEDFVPMVENQALLAEVNVPLVSNKPMVQSLSLLLAVRSDDYDISGPFEGPADPFSSRNFGDTVPKLGLTWYPSEVLKIRATWGEAYQTPTLVELFRPPDVAPYFFPIFDPFDPEDSTIPRFVDTVFGGNSNLKPQTSETSTIGFDYNSRAVDGLNISVTWSDTEFTDLISQLSEVFPFFDATPALLVGDSFPDAVVRDEAGFVQQYSPFLPINLASRTSESLDFSIQYAFATAGGDFEIGLQGVRQLALELVSGPGIDPVETTSTENAPADLNANAFFDWRRGSWTTNLNVNYESGYTIIFDDRVVRPEVDGYTTVDARVGYDMPPGWRFSIGINNLFDEDFPFADNGAGVDSSRVDFRRRVVYVDVTKDFEF